MRTTHALAACACLMALTGCDPSASGTAPATSGDAAPLQPPSFEQFLAEASVLEDGRLIVDQDILVEDVAAARAYYDRELEFSRQAFPNAPGEEMVGLGTSRQPLTVHVVNGADSVWPVGQRELTYCVNTATFGNNANLLLQTLEEATYSWSRRVGISFRRVDVTTCNNANTQVVFNVRQTALGGANASAFFPSDTRANRELLLDPVAFTTTAGGRDLLGILSHELGHALGLRHEHIWLTNPCTSELPGAARLVTAYDSDSVMHYPQCRPSGTGGYRQSNLDYAGTHTLYGMAPALTFSLL